MNQEKAEFSSENHMHVVGNASSIREGAMQALNTLRAQAKENGVTDMSLDDITKEIILSRSEK